MGDLQETSHTERSTLHLLESVAGVVAPLTLTAALLGYVGWLRSRAYFGYFGLNTSLVSYTPQDYVLQSAAVSFGAILFLVLTGVILLIFDQAVVRALRRASAERETQVRWALTGVGLLLILSSLGSAASQAMMAVLPTTVGAWFLGFGAIMLIRFGGRWSGRQPLVPPLAVGLAVMALALAAFWAASIYAENLGRGAAEDVDHDPRRLTVVTIYSREPLDLPGTNVASLRIYHDDQQWNYRYSGARLLVYSNNRWFIMPEPRSSRYRSSISILPDTDAIRVEVAVPH